MTDAGHHPTIILTMGSAHIRRIDRASNRRIRKMASVAVAKACSQARAQGARPITAVDDLTVQSLGPWIDAFAAGLCAAAIREGISISGGEMAQMPDSYAPGYVSVVVSVASLLGEKL